MLEINVLRLHGGRYGEASLIDAAHRITAGRKMDAVLLSGMGAWPPCGPGHAAEWLISLSSFAPVYVAKDKKNMLFVEEVAHLLRGYNGIYVSPGYVFLDIAPEPACGPVAIFVVGPGFDYFSPFTASVAKQVYESGKYIAGLALAAEQESWPGWEVMPKSVIRFGLESNKDPRSQHFVGHRTRGRVAWELTTVRIHLGIDSMERTITTAYEPLADDDNPIERGA